MLFRSGPHLGDQSGFWRRLDKNRSLMMLPDAVVLGLRKRNVLRGGNIVTPVGIGENTGHGQADSYRGDHKEYFS